MESWPVPRSRGLAWGPPAGHWRNSMESRPVPPVAGIFTSSRLEFHSAAIFDSNNPLIPHCNSNGRPRASEEPGSTPEDYSGGV